MHSCAWRNGQYQQVGPSSQVPTWLTHDTTRNRQAQTADNLCQYRTLTTGVRPPQSASFTFRNGDRQMSNWQTSAGPRQAFSSYLQPSGGKTYNCYQMVLNGKHQNLSTNVQNGNHGFRVTNGFQQDFHQNSTGNGKESIRAQDGKVVSNLQHCRVQRSLFQNVNGESTVPVSAYTTATSLPHEQVVCTSTLVSAHNRQTAHDQNHRQNGTQHGFPPSTPPPSYSMSVSQSLRNNSITTNSSSSGQILHSMNQTTQQYSTRLNSTQNNGAKSYSCSYETNPFLSKTKDLSINPAADTRQQMPSPQMMILSITDNLRNLFTAGSDGCPSLYTSSPYSGKHFVSEVTMMESNQNMQPVSTVAESYNSNASQSLPLNCGQSLPNTTHSVMSRTQQCVDVPPQQSSVPNTFYVTATEDGSESKAANAFPHKSNLAGSLSDAPQLMQPPETQSSIANNLEILMSVKPNYRSIHSSPGYTGARAVAVVQPLSQESYHLSRRHSSSNMIYQTGERNATDESLNNPEKCFISPAVAKYKTSPCLREGSNLYPENQNQVNTSSTASNDCTFVSTSDSAPHQDLSQKQLCADGRGSEPAVNMQVDERVAPTAQLSVTSEVPVSGDKNNSENPTDLKASGFELSSLPTVPWTAATLTNILQAAEKKVQIKLSENCPEVDSASKLLSMFWDGNPKILPWKLRKGWYKDLLTDVKQFCSKHVTRDSVILSKVKSSFRKQLTSYHVLKDNEVYLESPYKSSWLNVNEQLDDVDKEFGFQWFWKHRLHVLESDSQPDQVGTINSIPEQIVSEASNKVLPQTELEPVELGEEKQASTVEATSTQTASPNKTERVDSTDPYYSFGIHVLPPEEAKVVFEQAQSKMPQSMDTDSQPERVMNSSVEDELPEVLDVTLTDSGLENKTVCPIEQVCCIDRWMEIIFGSSTPSLSKCWCENEQSHKDFTNNTLDKEDVALQKQDKLCAISKFHSDKEGENQAKGGENINQIMVTIDITEDTDKPHSYSDEEPMSISQMSMNSSQSSIILLSEDKDEDLFFSSENETPNQMADFEKDSEQAQMKVTERSQSSGSDSSEKGMEQFSSRDTEIQSDHEVDCVQDQLKSTGITLSLTSVSSDKEVASQMSDLEDNYEQAQLTSSNVPESLETEEEQIQISASDALKTTFSLSGKHETLERKQKRPSSHDDFFPVRKKSKKCKPPVYVDSKPVLEGISKCRKVFVEATDSEPLASTVRSVELVLFGSAAQDKCALIGGRKRHITSPEALFDGAPRPPEVLTVKLSPLKRESSETVPTGEYSVRQRIHEKLKLNRKLKKPASLSGVNLKKAEMFGPTNTEELPVSSEVRVWNGNTKRCLSRKRRKSLSNALKRGGEKTRKDVVSLKRPADQERSITENGRYAVMSLQENNVLRFSVLPSTFNFKDGSNGTKETNEPVPDKLDFVEGKDESHTKTVKPRGTWCPNPEKKHCSPCLPPAPKSSSVFHVFKKKYMMSQPSMDE